MKKILLSGGMIVMALALVVGGTIAFYNDTETSTGNLFTAGSIDLTVDQTLASYNGEECGTCHLEIVSDNTTKVGNSPAVELSFVHPAWTADLDGEHVAGAPNDGANDGSKWIWITDGPSIPTQDQEYTFDRSFEWTGTASAAVLYLATDNLYTSVKLNGNLIGSTADENNFTTATEDVFGSLEGFLVQGTNILQVTVRNVGTGGSSPTSNPAGLLFKLEIDGTCQDGYVYQDTPNQSTCQLWGETDLDDEYFFNFDDVKPGDWGRNLISLHVDSNDAYACLIPHDLIDLDNTVVEPELDLGDDNSDGELDDELEFFMWEDNGDGAYQNVEPVLVGPGATIHEIQTEMIAMNLVGGGPTSYLGVAWCAGTQTVNGNNIECDGAGMGDIAQTDSLLASISAYVEQTRNNPNFSCEDVNLNQQP
jgi:predicted ribosomally synthesized peptide with SipW-like signal peptide